MDIIIIVNERVKCQNNNQHEIPMDNAVYLSKRKISFFLKGYVS